MFVKIFHNVAMDDQGRHLGYLDGYGAEHPLTLVYAYQVDDGCDPLALCEGAYHNFNVGDDPSFGTPDPDAVEYRRRRNRSLSIGDVISLGLEDGHVEWYRCAEFGWTRVGLEPIVRDVTIHGTTPLSVNNY